MTLCFERNGWFWALNMHQIREEQGCGCCVVVVVFLTLLFVFVLVAPVWPMCIIGIGMTFPRSRSGSIRHISRQVFKNTERNRTPPFFDFSFVVV